jgi:tRNA-specific 2-thiouridylase
VVESVAVALSGGVDSAIAAHLLLCAGYRVHGIHMRTWQSGDGLGECPWADDLENARAVADHLHIPLTVVNMMADYGRFVVQPLLRGYAAGETPNPDMLCNRWIKFGALLHWAQVNGHSFLATGHYCRTEMVSGEVHLLEGNDPNKDQSYFLAQINRLALPHLLFPVGRLLKSEVRRIAREIGLPNANRKDSQDVCFLSGRTTMFNFLRHHLDDSPGVVVDQSGKVLGRHLGLHLHTIGQRHGLAIASNRDNDHYIVVGKDFQQNQLIVSLRSFADVLWSTFTMIHSLNFLGEIPQSGEELRVKARYRDPATIAKITFPAPDRARIDFSDRQWALAPGQHLAFYRNERLLGGGIYFPCIGDFLH